MEQKRLQMSLMEVNDEIRSDMLQHRHQDHHHGHRVHLVDTIPFLFRDMSFRHDGGDMIFANMNFEMPQGKLVAITSTAPGIGRSTLLKLIGQVVFPSQGTVFSPVRHPPLSLRAGVRNS